MNDSGQLCDDQPVCHCRVAECRVATEIAARGDLFFTVKGLDRRSDLLVMQFDALRDAVR